MTPPPRFVVTGCGRSGTGYVAARLTAAGIPTGHEDVFTSRGPQPWGEWAGDASWFAAPHLTTLPPGTPVIHLVRDPDLVVRSFHRLGLFTPLAWRAVLKEPSVTAAAALILRPGRLVARVRYLRDVRRCLSVVPGGSDGSEIDRIAAHWVGWNELVEQQAGRGGLRYLRVRIEDIEDSWEALGRHLGRELPGAPPGGTAPANPKPRYRRAAPTGELVRDARARALAARYGYDYDADAEGAADAEDAGDAG